MSKQRFEFFGEKNLSFSQIFLSLENLRQSMVKLTITLQSLTGSLQGRITYREIPVVITGNGFAEYIFFLSWLHSSPCFINIQNAALIPVMCTGNCQIILQGLKSCYNNL